MCWTRKRWTSTKVWPHKFCAESQRLNMFDPGNSMSGTGTRSIRKDSHTYTGCFPLFASRRNSLELQFLAFPWAVDSCMLESSVPGPSGVQSPAISAALACFIFSFVCVIQGHYWIISLSLPLKVEAPALNTAPLSLSVLRIYSAVYPSRTVTVT